MAVKDIVGERFHRLVVLSREPNDKHYSAMWLCRCDCGETKVVQGKALRRGYIKSCGCLRKEQSAENAKTRKRRPVTDWSQRQEKYCPCCENTLPVEDFGKNRSSYDGFTGYCKKCHRNKGYENRKKNWGSSRHYHLTRRYGISAEEADALLENQGNICAICQQPANPQLKKPWHIDHDHKTGKVRGILCHSCNTALGNFNDDPEILDRALDYVKKRK